MRKNTLLKLAVTIFNGSATKDESKAGVMALLEAAYESQVNVKIEGPLVRTDVHKAADSFAEMRKNVDEAIRKSVNPLAGYFHCAHPLFNVKFVDAMGHPAYPGVPTTVGEMLSQIEAAALYFHKMFPGKKPVQEFKDGTAASVAQNGAETMQAVKSAPPTEKPAPATFDFEHALKLMRMGNTVTRRVHMLAPGSMHKYQCTYACAVNDSRRFTLCNPYGGLEEIMQFTTEAINAKDWILIN